MLFKNPSKKVSSLDLFINGTRIKGANSIKLIGVNPTPHLKWNEHCKRLDARANKRIYQLWRFSQINIDEECLLTLYKSWVRLLFLYANACWIDQSKSIINNIQLTQKRALRICMRKPRWYSVKKLHDEANIPAVRDFQIRLANEYLKRAKENKTESKLDMIQKKRQRPKKQLSKHTGPSVLLMFFTSSYIVEKPEQPWSNDLLPAACVVNSGQKSNKQRSNRTAKPAAHLVNSGFSCQKHQENNSNLHSFCLLKNLNRFTSF